MIRIPDPTKLGPAMGDLRILLGISRRGAARRVAKGADRTEDSVHSQMWTWDKAIRMPDLTSVGRYLDVLEYDLALAPRLDDPDRVRTLIAAIDNALRNGSYVSGANLALDMLCDELGIDRDALPAFEPKWAKNVPDRPQREGTST